MPDPEQPRVRISTASSAWPGGLCRTGRAQSGRRAGRRRPRGLDSRRGRGRLPAVRGRQGRRDHRGEEGRRDPDRRRDPDPRIQRRQLPATQAPGAPLPFLYESTGVETRFTNRLDPEPRSRRSSASTGRRRSPNGPTAQTAAGARRQVGRRGSRRPTTPSRPRCGAGCAAAAAGDAASGRPRSRPSATWSNRSARTGRAP